MIDKEIVLKHDKPIILVEGDHKRVILLFTSYKQNTYMKIAEQWRNDDESAWKFNKHQINLGTEMGCQLFTTLEQLTNLPEFITNVEDFMVNGQEMTYTERKEVEREQE